MKKHAKWNQKKLSDWKLDCKRWYTERKRESMGCGELTRWWWWCNNYKTPYQRHTMDIRQKFTHQTTAKLLWPFQLVQKIRVIVPLFQFFTSKISIGDIMHSLEHRHRHTMMRSLFVVCVVMTVRLKTKWEIRSKEMVDKRIWLWLWWWRRQQRRWYVHRTHIHSVTFG